ncbi:hypothetical protein ANO14919_054010 [Xylariales sp. No.14919]|nr:hypothetical protein ANO14919_054010 [Xylariales sp. No.14919]
MKAKNNGIRVVGRFLVSGNLVGRFLFGSNLVGRFLVGGDLGGDLGGNLGGGLSSSGLGSSDLGSSDLGGSDPVAIPAAVCKYTVCNKCCLVIYALYRVRLWTDIVERWKAQKETW